MEIVQCHFSLRKCVYCPANAESRYQTLPPSSSCHPQSNVELQNPAEGRREERKWGQGDLFFPQFTEAEGGCVIVSQTRHGVGCGGRDLVRPSHSEVGQWQWRCVRRKAPNDPSVIPPLMLMLTATTPLFRHHLDISPHQTPVSTFNTCSRNQQASRIHHSGMGAIFFTLVHKVECKKLTLFGILVLKVICRLETLFFCVFYALKVVKTPNWCSKFSML